MKDDPFEKFDTPSEYLLPGENEEQIISNIEERISSNSGFKHIIPMNWVIGIAASLLLFSIYFMLQPKLASDQQLVQSYFKPYKNYQLEQTRGPLEIEKLTDAYEAYDEHNYELAIINFEKFSLTDPLDQLYYAIALQGIEQWSDSKEVLINLENEIPQEHYDAWTWHTALNNIMLGEKVYAIKLLKELSEGKSQFKYPAIEMMKKLN